MAAVGELKKAVTLFPAGGREGPTEMERNMGTSVDVLLRPGGMRSARREGIGGQTAKPVNLPWTAGLLPENWRVKTQEDHDVRPHLKRYYIVEIRRRIM